MNKWYEIIVEERKRKLLNAKKFAEMVGVTPIYLCRIEKGKQIPSLKLLNRICKILNLNFAKMAEKVGYSEQIKETTEVFCNENEIDIKELVLKLCYMPAQDFSLVLDFAKQVSKLTQKEKDIIGLIISSYVENSPV